MGDACSKETEKCVSAICKMNSAEDDVKVWKRKKVMIIVDQRKCNGKIDTITTRQSMYVYGIGSKYMDFL